MNASRRTITQGEFAVSDDPSIVISTLLGSCVACCLWDPLARVGGMNHMLLTAARDAGARANLAGVNAMELLINGILKRGGMRGRLQAKVFGGAQMVQGLSEIGIANCAFALEYLTNEDIPVVSQSLGGTNARNVLFFPTTGAVRQKIVAQRVVEEIPAVAPPVIQGNDIELL